MVNREIKRTSRSNLLIFSSLARKFSYFPRYPGSKMVGKRPDCHGPGFYFCYRPRDIYNNRLISPSTRLLSVVRTLLDSRLKRAASNRVFPSPSFFPPKGEPFGKGRVMEYSRCCKEKTREKNHVRACLESRLIIVIGVRLSKATD